MTPFKYSNFVRLQAYEQISYRLKHGGKVQTQTALDFKHKLELITRNNIFQKQLSVT